MVTDGTQEPQERQRPERVGATVARGGKRTAVNHRVTDFDAGGPSGGEKASGLAREQRDQGGDQLLIGLVEQQGRGQLALKTADKLCDLGWIGRANHDRRRSEIGRASCRERVCQYV